jgi:hypothetical protein
MKKLSTYEPYYSKPLGRFSAENSSEQSGGFLVLSRLKMNVTKAGRINKILPLLTLISTVLYALLGEN